MDKKNTNKMQFAEEIRNMYFEFATFEPNHFLGIILTQVDIKWWITLREGSKRGKMLREK